MIAANETTKMRLVVKIKAPQHGLFNTRILLALFVASQLASATTLQLNAASATQPSLSSKSTVDDKKNLKSDDLHASSSDVRLSSLASANQKLHDQVASPTMASVHQVWTSTSSGSLEELSPELIGKLRNDVPFLAAYALRPRLVGSTATLGSETRIPGSTSAALRTGEPLSTQLQAPSSAAELAASSSANSGLQIQATQQGKQVSLLPRLGDFSEFNVETSSTSKSEHSHRRRTTLKRKKPAKSAANLPQMKARKVTGAGQLKRKGRKPTKASPLKRRSKVKASRAAKLKKRLNIIRSGRYYQEQSISPSRGAINQVDVEERAVGDQTTMLAGETKGAAPTDEGVKGGNASGAKKPFYSKRIPSGKPGSSEVEAGERNGAKNDTSPTLDGAVTEDAGKENSVDDELGEEIDDLPDSAPRRVGDDDVEEGGDTVMVEPKSDGVDDDPDPAEYEPAVPEENELEGRQRESETEENQRENEKEEDERELNNEPEPRARRVHRERQNTSPASEQPDSPPRSQDDEKGTAAGGGIGATTGGAGSSDGAGSSGGKKRAEDEADEDEDDSRVFDDKRRKSTGKESENKSADEEDNKGDEQEDAGQREAPENTSGGKGSRRPDEDEPEEETSGGKRVGSTTSSQNSDDERRADSEEERLISERRRPAEEGRAEDEAAGDVDYRDELEAGARKKPDEESSSTANKDGATRHKTTANECAHHGSYSHDDEHHHHHHDTIRWLEEAVPGEPGKDYPILNRINSSLFKCAEQKYPGYYADVEARCQVSALWGRASSSLFWICLSSN